MTSLAKWSTAAGACAALACVPDRAGYDDVRSLTAERLGQEARWQSDEQGLGIDEQARKLLDQPLNADAAARVALLNSPRLQASFEELGVARAELVEALRLPNPNVGGAIRYGAERPEVEVEAMISLSEFVFLPFRNGTSSAGLDARGLDVAGQAVDVAFDARAAFYEVALAEQNVELSRSMMGALWAASDMADRLRDAGNVTELERASEQIAYEEARLQHAWSEAELQRSREALNEVLGLYGPEGARWTASAKLPPPTPVDALTEDAEARAVAASLELAAGKRRYEHAAKRARLARAEGWVPDLRAGVSAERGEEGWGIGPAAELELPLFYQGQGATDGALAQMKYERRLLSQVAVAVRSRARTLTTRLEAAERGLRFYEETVLPLKGRVVEEAQLQYNAMQIDVFRLLAAKRDALAAERTRLELLGEYWAARNELERLLAGRLGSSAGPSPSPIAASRSDAGPH